MNEKKKIEYQQKMISRQSEQIDKLKIENENLKLKCEEKDRMIHSIASLKEELKQNVDEVKSYKKQYKDLIDELRKMKEIMNSEVFKNRWWLIKLLIK